MSKIKNPIKIWSKGQSIVELVFSVGVVALVLTGAVVLLLNSLSTQSKRFDRKKASELAALVVEDLVELKNNDPMNFWDLNNGVTNGSRSGFDGDYTYSSVFTRLDSTYDPGCSNTRINCAKVVVTVTYVRDTTETVTVSRLFTRN